MVLLIVTVAVALVTQVPLAITLEKTLHSGNSNLFASVFTIGVPEELAKAIPVIVIALAARRRLAPADYLFLGAVSGLVFGASEAVHYLTNGAGLGRGTISDLVASLDFVWRFPTDPITHACWAGITGYFIGLAISGRYRWFKVCWLGLAIASILHGLNDWNTLNGHWGWAAVVVVSGLLFLTYAKADPPGTAAGETPVRTAPVPVSLQATVQAPVQAPARAATAAYDVEEELATLKRQLSGDAGYLPRDRQRPPGTWQ